MMNTPIVADIKGLGGRLVMMGIGLLFAYFVVKAVRTGKVEFRHARVYTRAKDPGTFWFHVSVYTAMACAGFGMAVFGV